MSPRRAQNLLSIFASYILRKKMIQSLLCFRFPDSSFVSPIRPARLQPVYFPGWILDVELQGQVAIKGDDRPASTQVQYAYIPGSDHKVLSSASLVPSGPWLEATVPFSNDLLRQHDLDIECIPYNISPFSILDIVSHLSYAEATIEPNFRLIPSTVKAELFAAYPILLPVYLAQYEVETTTGTRLHTLFIEAYDNMGHPWSEPFAKGLEAQEARLRKILNANGLPPQDNQGVFNLMLPKLFVGTAKLSSPPHHILTGAHNESLLKYINKAMNLPGAATALAAASVRDFDQLANDPRVREFTPQERNAVTTWLSSGSDPVMFGRMYEAVYKPKTATVKNSGRSQQNLPTVDKILDEYKALQAQRLKCKPHWAKM